MKINPKECKSYGRGGYCCATERNLKCRDKCNSYSWCAQRLRCHVKIGSDTKCISFKSKGVRRHNKEG